MCCLAFVHLHKVEDMAEEDLGRAYDGQDDINDKLVLDLAWERQQKKVSGRALVGRCSCKLNLLF